MIRHLSLGLNGQQDHHWLFSPPQIAIGHLRPVAITDFYNVEMGQAYWQPFFIIQPELALVTLSNWGKF